MKSPLSYLLLTKLKNTIKTFFRSPVKIIYFVVIAAIIVITFIGGSSVDGRPGRIVRDLRELSAIITLLYSVMFVLIAYKGFSHGASMFSMTDVNMIFTAPFRQQKILFYGLFQQLWTSLLLGLFLLFQFSWLHNSYNITYGQLLVVLLGYTLTVFFAQITAMVIYAFTSADDTRKRAVKIAFITVVGAFLVYAAVQCIGDTAQILQKTVETLSGAVVKLFPVSGWFGRAASGVLTGGVLDIVIGLSLAAAYLILLVCLITFGKHDFYEDVLKSSEITQSAITARKEGRVGDAAPRNVKAGKTGIRKGFGANTIYYKHKLENRRSRVMILEPMSLTFAVIMIVMSIFMKSAGITAIFIMTTTMQIFSVALGRFNKELLKPYIYMIPEPPLKKMLYGLAEALPSAVTEAILVFVPIALIMGLGPAEAVFCILARVSCAFLFTTGNIVLERIWSGASKTFVMFLYFIVILILSLPGIVMAGFTAILFPQANLAVAALAALSICNIPVAVLALFLCRNMLQYAELNQR